MSDYDKNGTQSTMGFTDFFRIEPGESRDQIINKMEVILGEVNRWVKEGYEHDPAGCNATIVDGEKRGGWIDPKTGTCSLCGFYVGILRNNANELRGMLSAIRDLPETYRYGMPPGPPKEMN